ncbi:MULTISPECIES: NlpC/P60 family protein [Cohaesibacter]|uniref:NlpC/P60 family protein n=1 Tax=Cohaesibacter TaxID=655352 RepID=UPI000DE80731|nr:MULTISPECIES: NlpC/P60 family protein [Cohaesibacter]TLP44817.1 peptidase P60 [Cohaesibacter sp. CAU 1516]
MKARSEIAIGVEDILSEALSWEGTPYRHQASCKGFGCDCLGLVRGVYSAFWPNDTPIPTYNPGWADAGGTETLAEGAARYLVSKRLEDRSPGDVLLFRYRSEFPAKHAGILLTGNQFLHAHHNSAVCRASLSDWWERRIAYAFAFPLSLARQTNKREIHP